MRKKLLNLLICMLLIFSLSTVVSSNQIQTFSNDKNTCSADDVAENPEWFVNGSWTYNLKLNWNLSSNWVYNFLRWETEDMMFRVSEVRHDSYNVDFLGHIVKIGNTRLPEKIIISGDETILKENLAVKERHFYLGEPLHPVPSAYGWPGNTPVGIQLDLTYDPPFTLYDFPIYVGKSWEYDHSDVQVDYIVYLPDGSQMTGVKNIRIKPGSALCKELVKIDIPAGEFKAYRIIFKNLLGSIPSDNDIEVFYSPEVENIVKSNGIFQGTPPSNIHDIFSFFEYNMKLLSTTYIDDSPYDPDKPSGPTRGKPDLEYTYTTNSGDPNGDNIYYKWYFGDELTEWIPSSYGETVKHIWERDGTYEIKVKVKDENNAESKWSEPLIVIISSENLPPATPVINGPSQSKPNRQLVYRVISTDPEGDTIYYKTKVDGVENEWVGPVESDEIFEIQLSFSSKGMHTLSVKAKDEYGAESDWGTLPINIPKPKSVDINLFLAKFIQEHSSLSLVIQRLFAFLY